RVTIECVRSADVPGEVVPNPIVVDIAAKLEGVAAYDFREIVPELFALDVGEARRDRTGAERERRNVAIAQDGLRAGGIGLAGLVIADILEAKFVDQGGGKYTGERQRDRVCLDERGARMFIRHLVAR